MAKKTQENQEPQRDIKFRAPTAWTGRIQWAMFWTKLTSQQDVMVAALDDWLNACEVKWGKPPAEVDGVIDWPQRSSGTSSASFNPPGVAGTALLIAYQHGDAELRSQLDEIVNEWKTKKIPEDKPPEEEKDDRGKEAAPQIRRRNAR